MVEKNNMVEMEECSQNNGVLVSRWIRLTFVYKTCVNCIKLLQFMVILYVGSSGLGIIKKGG